MKSSHFIFLGLSLIILISLQTYSVYGDQSIDVNNTINNGTDNQTTLEETTETTNVLNPNEQILDEEPDISEAGEVQTGGDEIRLNNLGNASSTSFNDLIFDGKTTFLNVLNIKPNTIISSNKITCFWGDDGANAEEYLFIKIDELACDGLIVFEKNESYKLNTIKSYGPVKASKLLTAIGEGINKPISACAKYTVNYTFEPPRTNATGIDCKELFIAYK